MSKSIEFIVENPKPFSNYLKKFNSISNTVLFEIDGNEMVFITKASNEERSIVKYCKASFTETEFQCLKKFNHRIKIGIYNISRLIRIMDQFGGKFEFNVKYDELSGKDQQIDYAAISILLKNNELKFNIDCVSLNIFRYISDEVWNNTINKIDSITSFYFSKENIEKVISLCDLDKENKFIEFKNINENIYAKGRSFEYLLSPLPTNKTANLSFYKDQFYKVDVENYTVKLGTDRMIFDSEDTNTVTVISKVEKDSNYDEVDEDPFK